VEVCLAIKQEKITLSFLRIVKGEASACSSHGTAAVYLLTHRCLQ